MFIEEIRKIKGNRREWRNFGLTMGVFFALLGGLLFWRGRGINYTFIVISVVFLFTGAFLPTILRPIYKAWMAFAVVMGWVMTRIILCVLFYLVLTPLGLLAKLSGREFLKKKFREPQVTYWIPKEAEEKNSYDCQY